MAPTFRRRGKEKGRLHVGYRRRDWREVWYEPIYGTNPVPEIGLYAHHSGSSPMDEPMEGEIAWLPPFDPKYCETSSKPEQRTMQKLFLINAYTYSSQKDPEEIVNLNEKLEDLKFRRWSVWFEEAKNWKKKDIRNRQSRRADRAATAEAAGLQQEEAEINSDSSEEEEDDGYESEEDEAANVSPKRKSEAQDTPSPKKSRPDVGSA